MGPRYRHAPRTVGRRVHGKMVLIRLGTLEAVELNETGARVWELAPDRTREEMEMTLGDDAAFLDALVAEAWLVTI